MGIWYFKENSKHVSGKLDVLMMESHQPFIYHNNMIMAYVALRKQLSSTPSWQGYT